LQLFQSLCGGFFHLRRRIAVAEGLEFRQEHPVAYFSHQVQNIPLHVMRYFPKPLPELFEHSPGQFGT
jgi:hypothetical protein